MADTSLKARKAIYASLNGDTAVTNIVSTRIYAGTAPQNAAYPYIVIGDRVTDKIFNPKDATIQSHRLRIYAYSRKRSPIQIENLKASIFDNLEKANLTVTGATIVDCVQSGLDDVGIMEDGLTYRAILEFLVTIQ